MPTLLTDIKPSDVQEALDSGSPVLMTISILHLSRLAVILACKNRSYWVLWHLNGLADVFIEGI